LLTSFQTSRKIELHNVSVLFENVLDVSAVLLHQAFEMSPFADEYACDFPPRRAVDQIILQLEMWANAERDGRPAEYRWRPLFNAAKFG